MNRNYTCTFITQKESSISCKRLFLDGNTSLTNLYTTNSNIIFIKILLCLFKVSETIKIDLLICTMISKYVEFFHCFHFFTILRFVSNVNNLLKTEGTSTTNNAADVIFLSNIMEEEISFGELFLHFFYNQLLVCY